MPSESSISKEQANPNEMNATAIRQNFAATIAPAEYINSINVSKNPAPNIISIEIC